MATPQVVSGVNLHVAGYTRQSYGRVNGSERALPASQRNAYQARFESFAAEPARQGREATWCDHCEDVGLSAYGRTQRPDFERLLRDCRTGRIDVVIVYDISRLSRLEPLDAMPIVNELQSLGGYVGGMAPFGRRLRQETRTAPGGRPVAIQTLVTEPAEAEVLVADRRSLVSSLFCKRITVRKALPTEKSRGSRGSRAKAVVEPRVSVEWVREPEEHSRVPEKLLCPGRSSRPHP